MSTRQLCCLLAEGPGCTLILALTSHTHPSHALWDALLCDQLFHTSTTTRARPHPSPSQSLQSLFVPAFCPAVYFPTLENLNPPLELLCIWTPSPRFLFFGRITTFFILYDTRGSPDTSPRHQTYPAPPGSQLATTTERTGENPRFSHDYTRSRQRTTCAHSLREQIRIGFIYL